MPEVGQLHAALSAVGVFWHGFVFLAETRHKKRHTQEENGGEPYFVVVKLGTNQKQHYFVETCFHENH